MELRTDNLVIPQGTTWEVRWPIVGTDGQPAELSGWNVRAQVRKSRSSADVLHQWQSPENASIVDSQVSLRVTAAESSAWDWTSGVYDVEMFAADGRVVRVTQGQIRVDPEVTRD